MSQVTLYCGPMKSDKSSRLIQTGLRLIKQKKSFLSFKPTLDTRNPNVIWTRDPHLPSLECIQVKTPLQILNFLPELPPVIKDTHNPSSYNQEIFSLDSILLDEVFMWDSSLFQVLDILKNRQIDVYIASLDRDYRGYYFPLTDYEEKRKSISDLMEYADKVYILKGTCEKCGNLGDRTWRSTPKSEQILVDESIYEVRCEPCHRLD